MSTKTRAELVVKILEKLGVLPEGAAPNVEETARVDNNLPALLAELAAREIVYVADINAVHEAFFLSLAAVCAYELRDEFGIAGEGLALLENGNAVGIAKLKVMQRGRPTYQPQRSVYV